MKTLIVEDNPTVSKLLHAVLTADGFNTAVAKDGIEALRILGEEKINCIISDVKMPNMDGYRLVYKLRTNEKYRAIPIIMYSATYTSHDDERFALELGVSKYLKKPIRNAEILQTVRDLLQAPVQPQSDTASIHKNWVMKKYNDLLIEKLEKNIEELEFAKQEMETFSYKASHDLKGPLSSILGLIHLAHTEIQDPKALEYIGMFEKATGKLDKVLKQFINNLRIEQRNSEEQIDFTETISKVHSSLNYMQGYSRMTFDVNISATNIYSTSPVAFYANPDCIRFVFENIIENAIKYQNQNEPSPFLRIHITTSDDEVQIVAEDNGIGIAPQYLEKVFDMFFRATAASNGSGLGLYIIKKIIQRMKGRIEVRSVEEKGTTLIISLPVDRKNQQAVTASMY
jgi:signal transduction histidine kinase